MASYISGKDGTLTCNGVRLAKVASWGLTSSVEALEVTSLGDIARDYTPGLKSATGNCQVWLYDDAGKTLAAKVIRTDAPSDADKVTLTLGFGPKSVSFVALITQADLQMSVGSVMQYSLQFQVCGSVTGAVL
jgi:hypothetical protein